MLLLEPNEQREDKEISVFVVGGKLQRFIKGKTYAVQVVDCIPNPHILHPVGFEPVSKRWKARKDTTTPT